MRSILKQPSSWVLATCAIVSTLALAFAFAPWGIGVVHDSVFYLSAADNLGNGNGLVWNAGGEELRPLVHFPLGYSVALATFGRALPSILVAASALQAVALAATVLLIGWIIFLGSGNRNMSALGAVLAVASPILLERYLDVRSEPIFLALLLGSIGLLLKFLQTEQDRWLWGAGILTALAGLFRYAGLAALGSGMLAVLVLYGGSRWERLEKVLKYALIPTIMMILLALRNLNLSGTVANRVLAFHPPSVSVFRGGAVSISEWILPIGVDPVIRIMALAVIAAGVAALFYFGKGGSKLIELLSIYAAVYFGSLVVSLTIADASIRLNNRILAPLYIFFLVGIFTVIGNVPRIRPAVTFVVLAILAVYVLRTSELVADTRESGRGFSSKAWQTSPTVAALEQSGFSGPIYSNEALALYAILGQAALAVPELTDPVMGVVRPDYQSQLANMRQDLAAPQSALVLFHPQQLRQGMPALEVITEGLTLTHEMADGAIYIGAEVER